MSRRSLAAAALIVAGACGPSSPAQPDASGDGAGPDARTDCGSIAATAASADLRALADALVAQLWAAGHTGANGEVGGDGIFISQIRAGIPATDPGGAALAWLAERDAITFTAAELELANVPDWDTVDSAQLVVMRPRAGATPTRFFRPAAQLFLLRESTGWQIVSLTVWPSVALATADEAARLAACTPDAPPDEAGIRSTTFAGNRFVGCAPSGTYTYTPDGRDAIAWEAPITWEVEADGLWHILVPATLTIDPANYWPDIAEADCLCDDTAGFELAVDMITGAVVRYRPGIDCVVC